MIQLPVQSQLHARQASIGNVAAGSIFALVQGAAMTGTIPLTAGTIPLAVKAGVDAALAGAIWAAKPIL